MPTLQELNSRQTEQALSGAMEGHIPITATFNLQQSWHVLHGRLIPPDGRFLVLELEQPATLALPTDLRMGVSFKLKHYKHLCTATLLACQQLTRPDASMADALKLSWPGRMQRLQRRAYTRVDVPDNRIVRAACWLGSSREEPAAGSPTSPVWSGRVSNISAGGLQLVTDASASRDLDVGDDLGMRLTFGLGEQAVYVDAQVRYLELAGQQVVVGLQFVGLDHTAEGRETLSIISARIAEYQHLAEQAQRHRTA
jgi:hypothetical protein